MTRFFFSPCWNKKDKKDKKMIVVRAELLLLQLALYLIGLFFLRFAYNASIPKMNDQWKPIELREAFFLAVFLWVVGLYAHPLGVLGSAQTSLALQSTPSRSV